ncbi:NB-ARC domain-containing protein [Actinomadura sp. 7K507]|uniref:ATP-binding protein n=1 Tax=Actinomadura sp. 7K507 TaxID=2530365 RepID=UPI0014044DE1|nr:NB-ARC domain-containing protein [Actinomadura sp. 7K507]
MQTLNRLAAATALRPPDDGTGSVSDGDHGRDEHGDGDAQTLVVITGPGGVGKTALALRWLHQHRARYRDGQLFADLRAFSGTGPANPAQILEGFLRALGIGADNIPPRVQEQGALFRSLAARRRLIILLDNAASFEQVQPLLPGAGRNLVVVTSRRTLPTLRIQGAQYLDLAPLDETDALDLLTAMAGAEHTSADPPAARALVAQCGRLPLALTACGAHLATRPHATVSRLAAHLADERTRLSHLHTLLEDDVNDNTNHDTGDPSVSVALTTSYNALPGDAARRMYRLLSLHPGPDISVDLAAAVATAGLPEAERLLEVLAGARLLTEDPPGRFRFHDLTRLHAQNTSERIDSDIFRRHAFSRITTRLLQVAAAAQKTINPGRWYLGRHFNEPRVVDFPHPAAALDWLETERGNLMAILRHAHERGDHTSAWELAEAMWGLFTHRKHYSDFQQAHRTGLAAAETTGDLRAQARMLEGLASYHNNAGTFTDAAVCAQQALDLERQARHPIGEASALDMLGIAHLATGHLDLAADAFGQARHIHHQLGRPRGAALMTRHLGEVAARAGDHTRAIEHHTQAIAYFASHDHEQYLHARALNHRATSHLELGNLDHAHTDLHQAMDLAHQVDAPHEQANIHVSLARLAALRHDPAAQHQHLHQAFELYSRLAAPEADRIAEQLAE